MSSASALNYDFLVACKTHFPVTDPGDAGTFSFPNSGIALLPIVSGGTETRTVPAPTTPGQTCIGWLDTDGGGAVTVTVTGGATGLTSVVLTSVGDTFVLRAISVAGVAKWQLQPSGKGAALTTQLTALTIADAHTTPDYAIAALTTTTPYGFAGQDEAISFLYVVQNLQVRVAQLEARLQAAGIVA